MSRIAAYCGTRNIYSDMITSAKSLIANSPVEEVHMFIEDDDMGEELPNIIICHNVSNQTYFSEDSPNVDSSNDYMLMMYAALSNELNDNTVLALTANAIVQDDISEIWDMDIDNYYFAGVPIIFRSTFNATYCDFSVIYYNLAKMRNGKADECIDVLNHAFFPQKFQDVCNFLCQGYIYEMSIKYNTTRFTTKNRYMPAIISFPYSSYHTWKNKGVVSKWRDMSWEKVLEKHNTIVEQCQLIEDSIK